MVKQNLIPVKMNNGAWHWTVDTDTETYVLATMPESGLFVLMTLKAKTKDEYRLKELPTIREKFNKIEPGLYDWVERAVTIHANAEAFKKKYHNKNVVKIEGRKFIIEHNQDSDEIIIEFPSLSIITIRSILTDHYPEVMFIADGRFMNQLINYVSDFWKYEKILVTNPKLISPVQFTDLHYFEIDGLDYSIAYSSEADMLLLNIPKRIVRTHLSVIATACREVTEVCNGELYTKIQKILTKNVENRQLT